MKARRRSLSWALASVAAVVALAVGFAFLPAGDVLRFAIESVRGFGVWSGVVFVLLYVGLAMLAVPSTPLNIGAGLIFGLPLGFCVGLSGSALTAVLAFLVARYLASDAIRRRVKGYDTIDALFQAVEAESFKIVLVTRLNLFVPASIKNYGFGLTAVSFWRYVAGSVLGQVPIVLLHVWLGTAGKLTLFHQDAELDALEIALFASGLVGTAGLAWLLAYYARRQVKAIQHSRNDR